MQTWLGSTATFRAPEDTRGILFQVIPERGTEPRFPSPQRNHRHFVETRLADNSD